VRLGLESFQPAPFVTNFTDPKAARKWYRKRFSIETLFVMSKAGALTWIKPASGYQKGSTA
jgi:hypothetical protein